MKNQSKPWADFVRPKKLEDIVGQEELLSEDKFLARIIKSDAIPSMIFWGPPGSGKTSLANVIAKQTNSDFINFSAAISGVGEVRKIIERARQKQKEEGIKTILFIDEIHRFNKKQQDILLPHVERGHVILIGATTENPSFEVNSALLSRTRVFVLRRLSSKAIKKILKRTIKVINGNREKSKVHIKDDILEMIAHFANGDARTAINVIQMAVESGKTIDGKLVTEIFQKSHLLYDKKGEEHYNIISALHKSMRGGDADAALYWLARMIEGGEDPLYIARRLVRFASEDIGMKNNSALMLAVSTYQACHFLGYPECEVHLAHCVAYMTRSPKSVAVYKAILNAKEDVIKYGNLPVPLHIRNAPTKLMKNLGYGKGYKYSPEHEWKEDQEYLPVELKGRKYLK